MNLRDDLKTLLRRDVRLSQFTTMQVGGLANYFAEPSTEEELFDLIEFAKKENLPFMIMGKGSNLIFPDEAPKIKGIIAYVTSELAINDTNIVEIITGRPELIVYVNESDLLKAYETIKRLKE